MASETRDRGAPAAPAPLQPATIRDPIDFCDRLASPLSNLASHHRSPRTDELNHAVACSLPSSASTSATAGFGPSPHTHMAAGKGGQSSAARQGRAAQAWNNSSNPANPKAQSSPQPGSGLSPTPPSAMPPGAGASKAVTNIYTPLRLDSQLLGSPRPGVLYSAGAQQQLPSPTRPAGIAASIPHMSHWNAGVSPLPYPCGSPTAFHGAGHILSPFAHPPRFAQAQPSNSNDDASPMQASFSNLGRETSFLAASASAASPMTATVGHSTILDAPLQLSLVPPAYCDERPLFSFGNSLMQSSPYTPTRASGSSRRRSIYHDAMVDLAHTRDEAANPLAATSFGAAAFRAGVATLGAPVAMSRTTSGRPVGVGGHEMMVDRNNAITTSSFSQANGARTLSNANLYNSVGSPDTSVGNPDIVICMGNVDWHRPDRPSPSGVSLLEQAAGQRSQKGSAPASCCATFLESAADGIGAKRVETDEEADADAGDMDAIRQTHNSTPEILASTSRGSREPPPRASAVPTSSATEEPDVCTQQNGDTCRPQALDHTARTSFGNTGILSLSVSTVAYSDAALRNSATTPTAPTSATAGAAASAARAPAAAAATAEEGGGSPAADLVTPVVSLSMCFGARPLTPAAAVSSSIAVPDLNLFMPSPVDQGVHHFGGVRESAVRASPSEQSTSTLSLVPTAMGMWQASPLFLSEWQSSSPTPKTCLNTVHSLRDLLEVLRLLQSDIDNVYSKVSVSEHVVRRWVSGTFSLLLQLTTELRHSAALAAATTTVSSSSSPAMSNAAHGTTSENLAEYAQLRDDLTAAAASCGTILQSTADAIQRDQEKLEPLLLTAMLGRSATASLLCQLEKPYVTSRPVSHFTTTSTTNATTSRHGVATAGNGLNGSALRLTSVNAASTANTLTPERIEELLDSKTLREELNVHWPPFATAYNNEVLRYLCLRALYVKLSRSAPRPSCHTTSTDAAATLSSLVTDWVDARLAWWKKHEQQQQQPSSKSQTLTPDPDGSAAAAAMREGMCCSLPSFDQAVEALSIFHDGKGWRWWYTLLSGVMSCTFDVRENAGLFSYVEGLLAAEPSEAAAAALHDAIARRAIAVEEVEEQLKEVELDLLAMEERGKALRVEVLQCILRRIFVLTVVASVHRAVGKDAPVSSVQLATYVHLQRKSLEDAEAQLGAHHAECSGHLCHLRAFLALFPGAAATTPAVGTTTAADRTTTASTLRAFLAQRSSPLGAPPTVALDVSSEEMAQQWSSPMVMSLAALLPRPHSETGLLDRSDSTEVAAEYGEAEQARDAASLVRDVSARLVSTIQSLCVLLQSDVDAAEAHASYFASPARPALPSTRALRRLQASLAEAYHATRVCLSSLRLDG